MSDQRGDLSPKQLHEKLLKAVRAWKTAEQSVALLFVELLRRRLWRALGYSSIHQYASEGLGLSRAKTHQLIRLAESFERLPRLYEAVSTGSLTWTKAREVARVATPGNQDAWIARARLESNRELERMVREARARAAAIARAKVPMLDFEPLAAASDVVPDVKPAAVPDEAPASALGAATESAVAVGPVATSDVSTESMVAVGPVVTSDAVPDVAPVVVPDEPLDALPHSFTEIAEQPVSLSLRMNPLDFARFEAMMEKAGKLGLARGVSREERLLTLMESALGLAQEHRRQPVTGVTDDEGRSLALLEGPSAGLSAGEGRNDARSASHVTRVAGSPYQVIIHKCEKCGQASVQGSRGALPLGRAAMEAVECDCRTQVSGRPNRASIPPARRREVLARDHHRCRARGCGRTSFLEVHHVQPRSSGGGNEPANLVTLCAGCHRLLHEKSGAAAGLLPEP